ncbi:uncharacterized protein LOC101448952 [Ceratitis capitata]|uniref:(Mediterranean fruit fly) hypothetical protein n=1 Tax=Ceratitis capitata TaxID=7213 RepID=A0A811VIF2_CERCA|nr:uncharacterized protein LOC101448952 [Ceratitis capitata]CAD7014774.1 unnamed protein product [Ceratitis capitata]
MGGSRSYSVSSNGSSNGVVGSTRSENYSESSGVASSGGKPLPHKTTQLLYSSSVYKDGAPTYIEGSLNVTSSLQQQQPEVQRVRSQRVMCRCCLSEQQQQKQTSLRESFKSYPEQNDEDAANLEFVPLDTLAMVDLGGDNFITTPSAGGDSYKSPLSRMSSTKDTNKNSSTTNKNSMNKNTSPKGPVNNNKASSMNSNSINATLLDCLNAIARIGASLADNELPQHICLDCCHMLEMCCEFIRCVRNADKILRRRSGQPAKRLRQQKLLHQLQQQQSQSRPTTTVEEGSAAKRRRRSEEKVQQEHRVSVGRAGISAKSRSCNTPKSISLPNSVMTVTAAATSKCLENDELPDFGLASDCVESNFVRSFDSGIEIDEDLCSVKSSDCSANENSMRCHLTKYEGYTYVVADTLSHDLERFHRSGRSQTTTGESGAGINQLVTYKCGFCLFECTVRQELNRHLHIHLGPPQHSCRKCSFVGHFKFLLAQHMRNVHHCALEAVGVGPEGSKKYVEWSGDDIARSYGGEAEGPKYHCYLCSKCFLNYDGLQQHRKSHKVFCKCTMCAFKSSTRENVLEHLAKEHKILVERRLIVKYIPLQRINAQHSRELSPTRGLHMSAEPKQISKDNKYRKHLCQFCGKCFDRRFHLLKHEYGVHRTEIEKTTKGGVDALLRSRLSSFDSSSNSNKFTKLKYIRQRNSSHAARQKRCIEDLALLHGLQPGQNINSKFQCEVCLAVFMFNFELKYHMRTHKINTLTQTTLCKGLADECISSFSSAMSSSVAPDISIKPQEKLLAETGTEKEDINEERVIHVVCTGNDDGIDGEDEGDGDGEPVNDSIKPTHGLSNSTPLTRVPGGDDLDLMGLVAPRISPRSSLDASPASSNTSFDVNYDDQLYLNEFDLALLDCSGAFDGY